MNDSITEAKPKVLPVGDGRLCMGNGYFFFTYVGPLENPEMPNHKVHDKISRIWLGYSSTHQSQIDMAPRIREVKTGREWKVGACDSYRFEDGIMIMETELPVGTVVTETYGAWEQPVLIRKIRFIPKSGNGEDFEIYTEVSLFKDFLPPSDPNALYWTAYKGDERERPTPLKFPGRETIRIAQAESRVEWVYDDPRYRRVVIGTDEAGSGLEILDKAGQAVNGSEAVFEGTESGALRIRRACGQTAGELTVVMAFAKDLPTAQQLYAEHRGTAAVSTSTVQQHWTKWYEDGAVIQTGNAKLDQVYRVETMFWKIGMDAELGGAIYGRYQIASVWARDMAVCISGMLDAGHYEEPKKMLKFYSTYAYWNEKNNCINANTHASGRAQKHMCSASQPPSEDILQQDEWFMQMVGPQLDGMGYYLYCFGKYNRYTGDMDFVREQWPYMCKVADSLVADDYYISEEGQQGELTDENLRVRKYNPTTGLIVDNAFEQGRHTEWLITNSLAVLGFREAYRLSVLVGDEKPLWKQRAEELYAAIHRSLVRTDEQNREYLIHFVPHPWLEGKLDLSCIGYHWTVAATTPLFNYRDSLLKSSFERMNHVEKIYGWGMWWTTLAQAAFEADRAELGWRYLWQTVETLPESLQMYEYNEVVTGPEGETRRVTLNVFAYAYLPHAVIRGLAGFGYDENRNHWFFRPQIPAELGNIKARVRVGETRFEVDCGGQGDTVAEFSIDGQPQPLDGILCDTYLDGGRHNVYIRMK